MNKFLGILLWAFSCAILSAHNPGLSALRVEYTSSRGVDVTLQFAPPDEDGDGRASAKELADGELLLKQLSPQWLELETNGKKSVIPSGEIEVRSADEMLVWKTHLSAAPEGHWRLKLLQLGELVPGHREFVSILNNGEKVAEVLLSARDPAFEFDWPTMVGKGLSTSAPGVPSRTFGDFVRMGIEHILTGYDHMLYLAGLILVCRRFRRILPIITSFTLAHSLTLGLATVGAVTLSPAIVEPMIAASIVYVAVENIWLGNREPRRRWISAFLFGLIHGFGFAGLLREIGVGSDGHAVFLPLFSFNLGVELGQLAVVSTLLPLLSLARRQPRFAAWGVQACSAVVALVGTYWFVERVWF